MAMKVELRVRPVTRYVVTRWYQGIADGGDQAVVGGCEGLGEFDSEHAARRALQAFAYIYEVPIVDGRMPFAEDGLSVTYEAQ